MRRRRHCFQVDYETQDLTAVAGDDYVSARGTVVFEAGEKSARVS
jgi:solute carrier family 8 (sodium/calcium exchanger)